MLAGGLARRMGQRNKSGLSLAGRPLIRHVHDRIRGQVDEVIVNGSAETADLLPGVVQAVPDLSDDAAIEDFAGPMVGVLSVLEWAAAERPGAIWVATFPTDTPFLPEDFVARAREAIGGSDAELACAASGGRLHPVVALWPVSLAPALRRLVAVEGLRRADRILGAFRLARIDYETEPVDPFFNINRAEDLTAAAGILGE
ncbi:MAG: molybdenum cofactor guanylyltransferase [Rhodospirillales bacterium]|nr:molybdenum cofactor guanylyltransferase [Rhodospirillales bacterium]